MSIYRVSAGRSRIVRPAVLGITAVVMAVLVGASPVAAVTWIKTTLANAPGLNLQDASFEGHDVAVAWQQPGPVTKVRLSSNDGSSFSGTFTMPGHTRQASTDICGGNAYIAYARDYSDGTHPNLWLIEIQIRSMSGTYVGQTMAWPDATARGQDPDVACAGGRLYVTWEQRVGSQWHVYVNQALLSAPDFSGATPRDLGQIGANAGEPAATGAATRAYVAYPTPAGRIRIDRWGIGSGPSYAITDLGEQSLTGTGTNGLPRLAATGTKVVAVWYACGDARVRVSTNRGATWGATRTIFTGACGSEFGGEPLNVAIHGSRTIVSYHYFNGFTNQQARMISTTNDFGSWTDQHMYAGSAPMLLGFVSPSGVTKLAGAVTEGTRLRYVRQA